MATAVVIDDESSLTVEAYCINQPNKSSCHCKSHYFHFNKGCTQATRWNASVIQVGVVCVRVLVSRHLKEELA